MKDMYICIMIVFLLIFFAVLMYRIIDLNKENEKLSNDNIILKEELGFQKRRGDIYKKGCKND